METLTVKQLVKELSNKRTFCLNKRYQKRYINLFVNETEIVNELRKLKESNLNKYVKTLLFCFDSVCVYSVLDKKTNEYIKPKTKFNLYKEQMREKIIHTLKENNLVDEEIKKEINNIYFKF